jgi:tetratricopeptide (TPR) repeat protein
MLDELRYSDPEEVVRRIREVIKTAEPAEIPLALGVLGSAYRNLGFMEAARDAIEVGLRKAQQTGDWWTTANLAARLGYLLGDEGNWRAAVALASQSACQYLCAGDKDGVGRSLVDRARALCYLEHHTETLACVGRATSLLASDSFRHQYSALVIAGVAETELGHLTQATEHLIQAGEFAPRMGPSLQAGRLGLLAQVEELRGNLGAAEKALRAAADIYFSYSPIDSALASVRVVGLIIAQGDLHRARESASSLIRYNPTGRSDTVDGRTRFRGV